MKRKIITNHEAWMEAERYVGRAKYKRMRQRWKGQKLCGGEFHPGQIIRLPVGYHVIDASRKLAGIMLRSCAEMTYLERTGDIPNMKKYGRNIYLFALFCDRTSKMPWLIHAGKVKIDGKKIWEA